MKILWSALLVFATVFLSAKDCTEIKAEVIFYIESSSTSEKTNEILSSLSECGLDKYEIAMISHPDFFYQEIDKIVSTQKKDVTVEGLLSSFNQFKAEDSEVFKEYYKGIQQFTDYYSRDITIENLESFISDWKENNGDEVGDELKEYIIRRDYVEHQISIKDALNEFYSEKFNVLVFDENLNGVSWYNHTEDNHGQQMDKSLYENRISISAANSESEIVLTLEMAEGWSIYSINNEVSNIFKASVQSGNPCVEFSKDVKVAGEFMASDPMGGEGDVKMISGFSQIMIPYNRSCEEGVLSIEFTFSLIKDDGTSLPFIKEILELK